MSPEPTLPRRPRRGRRPLVAGGCLAPLLVVAACETVATSPAGTGVPRPVVAVFAQARPQAAPVRTTVTTNVATTTVTRSVATTGVVAASAPATSAAPVPPTVPSPDVEAAPSPTEPPAEPAGVPPAGDPPVNESSCRSDLNGAVMTIVMPDISYACPVYAGDQAMLDSGAVTLISRRGPYLLATQPGEAGTLWIAGHRSTHHAPFAAVPDLPDGSVVTVSDGNRSARYRVVGRLTVRVDARGEVVDGSGRGSVAATWDAIGRPDRGRDSGPRLLLQTCAGATERIMIYADLIAD